MATVTAASIAASVYEWRRPDRMLPSWRHVRCQQFHSDLDRYRDLIYELIPPFIVEIGASTGGTALFLADTLRQVTMEDAGVVSIDIYPPQVTHDRIMSIQGDSINLNTVEAVRRVAAGRRGLILIDGDHRSAHVARELELYAGLADYLIVEDTIMEWLDEYDDGPLIALDAWLPDHPEFIADPDPCPTQHPGGYLRRVT